MKKIIDSNWNKSENLASLKFFVQIVEDMLFDFNLSSYKLKMLNTHYLAKEFIIFYASIKKNIINNKAYHPIMEEFIYSFNRDLVVKELFGELYDRYLNEIKSNQNNLDILHNILSLIDEKLNKDYYIKAVEILKNLIYNNSNEKNKIRKITQIILSELVNKGYSKRFIYNTLNYLFFYRTAKIMNVRKIDSFFNHFNLKKNIYNVLFRAKKEDFIYQALEKTPFKIYNNLPSKYSRHQEFYKPDHIFIEIEKVEEFDQFSAKIQTEEALSIFESFIRYNHHKHNFEIDNQVLVLDDETSKVYKINEEMSGILKQPDKKIHSITKNTTKTFMLLKNLNASPELVLALKAHADAIRTDNVNHQFITLWTAIESMISVTGQKKNINNFIDALEPIFTLEYFFKYTYNLHNYLLKHYNEYKDILKKVPEGDTLFQKSVLLLALKTKNEPIRRELYKIISQNNPILCHKIYYLVNLINNNKSLYDGLKKHRKYIEWQIQRIYRARNIIVHSNKPIFYLNSLIENLHEYFDRIIDTIIRTSELNPHISSLSGIFYHLKIKSDHYLKILNTKDTINIDKKNFKRFILNEFNV